jgi:hypothetical protein
MNVRDFLDNHGIKLNTRYTISAGPVDVLSNSCIHEIDMAIRNYNSDHTGMGYEVRIPSITTLRSYDRIFGSGWDLYKYEEKSFATRYVKLVKQKMSVNLEDSFVGKIGEICKRLSRGETYSIDFVDRCEWDAGEFGESDCSCWWDEDQYNHARLALFEEGGGAIRIFEDEQSDNGIGRAWLYVKDNRLLLFNSYHNVDGLNNMVYGGMLAKLLKLEAYEKDVQVENAYINGNDACVIETEEQEKHSPSYFTLDFASKNYVMCDRCERFFRIEETTSINGSTYCDYCANDIWECDCCHDTYDTDDASYEVEGEFWCEYCYNRHAFTCDNCGDNFNDNQCHDFDGDSVCDDCYQELEKNRVEETP